MSFDWWTFALQAINLLILVWLLQRFLYRPVLAAVASRRAKVAAVLADAESARAAVTQEREQLAAEREGIAKERTDMLAAAKVTVEESAAKAATAARAEADRLLAQATTMASRERETAGRELIDLAADLGVMLARRLLETTIVPPQPGLFLDRVLKALDEMPQEKRQRLAGTLDGEPVHLVSAQPLAPEEVERCRLRLTAALGQDIRIEASVDPALIAGIDLRLPHAMLDFSWHQLLEDARKELVEDGDTRQQGGAVGA